MAGGGRVGGGRGRRAPLRGEGGLRAAAPLLRTGGDDARCRCWWCWKATRQGRKRDERRRRDCSRRTSVTGMPTTPNSRRTPRRASARAATHCPVLGCADRSMLPTPPAGAVAAGAAAGGGPACVCRGDEGGGALGGCGARALWGCCVRWLPYTRHGEEGGWGGGGGATAQRMRACAVAARARRCGAGFTHPAPAAAAAPARPPRRPPGTPPPGCAAAACR